MSSSIQIFENSKKHLETRVMLEKPFCAGFWLITCCLCRIPASQFAFLPDHGFTSVVCAGSRLHKCCLCRIPSSTIVFVPDPSCTHNALCRVTMRSSTNMIPPLSMCPEPWDLCRAWLSRNIGSIKHADFMPLVNDIKHKASWKQWCANKIRTPME